MSVASLGLVIGLNLDWPLLSCLAVFVYIFGFGVGPGPLTWVLLAEAMPPDGRNAGGRDRAGAERRDEFRAGELGTPWTRGRAHRLGSCALIPQGSTFLPLQQVLMTAPTQGEGNVFWLLVFTCFGSALVVDRAFASYQRTEVRGVGLGLRTE